MLLQAFAPSLPVTVHRTLSIAALRPRRRPRAPIRPAAHLHHDDAPPPPHDSYIQCVECLAVYHIEPEEVEGTPRIVACSACLHEWMASDADLLWGHEEAVTALAAAARRRVEGSAFIAARGVEKQQQKDAEVVSQRRRKFVSKNGNGNPDDDDDDEHFNVFVGNLSFRATEEDLYRAFSGYGAVLSCQVPSDSSGASRGYGFVEMRSKESALRAIESLQGASILGRDVSLNEAKPKREQFPKWRSRRSRFVRREEPRYRERREEFRSSREGSRFSREGSRFSREESRLSREESRFSREELRSSGEESRLGREESRSRRLKE